jgi:hypothetical protein
MEPLLIIIAIILLLIIGYVLSRPFEHPPETAEMPHTGEDPQADYQDLLNEIKLLQRELESSQDTAAIEKKIEIKKRQAADLLRRIKPSMEKDRDS